MRATSSIQYRHKIVKGAKLIHLSLSQEEVIQAVEKVCTYLPASLSGQCKDLIETYGQAIIELLLQQADPKTVCTVLALCKEARRAYVRKFSLAEVPQMNRVALLTAEMLQRCVQKSYIEALHFCSLFAVLFFQIILESKLGIDIQN